MPLAGLAAAAAASGLLERAARLVGAAKKLEQDQEIVLPGARRQYLHHLALTEPALNHGVFTTAFDEGGAMSLEVAVAYAMSTLPKADC